ncbi:DeoR/GlpR family DNA-binding transcription regulator [Mesobacillus campisalis]|nr:DeoR/GlpR family DNA-binding transcription regulator [Mesobacillus campisalis]
MIMNALNEKGKVLVAELAILFEVTPETIRRDLHIMEEERKLTRVHGGAILYSKTQNEPHFEQKQNMMYKAKCAIGKKAASFIEDGDVIVIDVGTTTLQLSKEIKDVTNITIVTNSIAAAYVLNDSLERKQFDGKVIVVGGNLNPEQKSLSGTVTCRMLEEFQFNKAFISCGGIMPPDINDYDMEEANASSMMVKQANQVFLLADSSKVNHRSFSRICDLSDIDYVICDKDIPEEWKLDQRVNHQLKWIAVGGDRT